MDIISPYIQPMINFAVYVTQVPRKGEIVAFPFSEPPCNKTGDNHSILKITIHNMSFFAFNLS